MKDETDNNLKSFYTTSVVLQNLGHHGKYQLQKAMQNVQLSVA